MLTARQCSERETETETERKKETETETETETERDTERDTERKKKREREREGEGDIQTHAGKTCRKRIGGSERRGVGFEEKLIELWKMSPL
jgi:hypothetical protein